MTDIDERLKTLAERLQALMSAQQYAITDVAKEKIATASVSGVYAISIRDGGAILYVGKNTKATVAKRSFQHVNTQTKSDLKGMIKLYKDLPQNLNNYVIRWIEIEDARERHFFEAFAMGVIQPRMNFKEKALRRRLTRTRKKRRRV